MRGGGEAVSRLAGGIHPLAPAAELKLLGFAWLDGSFPAHGMSHARARRRDDLTRPWCIAMGGWLVLAASLLLAANPAQAESAKEAVARLHAQVSQGATSVETWRQLARALAETGDLAGAEAALLTGLKQDPDSAPALRDLGKLYIDTNRTTEALPFLEQALSQASDDQETRDALSYALYQTGAAVLSLEVSNHGQPLGPAQAEALVEAARFYTERGHPEAAQRALAKAHELAPNSLAVLGALLKRSEPSAEGSAKPTQASPSRGAGELTDASPGVRAPWEISGHFVGKDLPRAVVVGLASSGALLMLAALRIFFVLLRGSGDLAVTIDYPEERKGSFSVRLSRHSARVRRRAGTSRARTREAEPPVPVRVSSRLEHTFVTRETHFRSLPARRWFVRVEGTLEADGASPIGQVELEQEIRVERGRVSQACFELCGEE